MATADTRSEREITPQLERELARHAGRWVATTRDRLVAVGDGPAEVYEKARAEGVKAPTIFRVPEKSARAHFF